MKDIQDNSIDLLFCDLPYGQTSCSWDCEINLEVFWKEVNRICKERTPMFFCCSTKFGVSLINSNPKNFRYDLVWVKSAAVGFLNSKKMPMRKHEMVYVFYRKLPLYDISSHKHKFIIEDKVENKVLDNCYGENAHIKEYIGDARKANVYDPPLPNSVITTKIREPVDGLYGSENKKKFIYENGKLKNSEPMYEPPLPNSVIRDTTNYKNDSFIYGNVIKTEYMRKNGEAIYEPQLPTSLLDFKSEKGKHATQKPVELIKWILKYYSKEGDVVLDPTMGSGSTGIACRDMDRKFIGIEKDEEIYANAIKRLFD
jgi:DNA modification methylase